MTLCRHYELVEVHDEISEWMNMGVVADNNIDDGNFESDEANNDLNREWELEGFLPDEETKNCGIERIKCLPMSNLPNGGLERDILRVSMLIETRASAPIATNKVITSLLAKTH